MSSFKKLEGFGPDARLIGAKDGFQWSFPGSSGNLFP